MLFCLVDYDTRINFKDPWPHKLWGSFNMDGWEVLSYAREVRYTGIIFKDSELVYLSSFMINRQQMYRG